MIARADFEPAHRVCALEKSNHLTPETISQLKAFLQQLDRKHKCLAISCVPVIESGTFFPLAKILSGMPEQKGEKILYAALGKSLDVLQHAATLPVGDRLGYLNDQPRSANWVYGNMGKSWHADQNVIIHELQARLFANEHDVLTRLEEQLDSADRDTLLRTCNFILFMNNSFGDFNYKRLGWHEDHNIVQDAIRKRIVASQDITDPKNPWFIWNQMLARREVATNFEVITPEGIIFGGKNVRLNPSHIAKFSHGFLIDEASVPTISPTLLNTFLEGLEGRLNSTLRAGGHAGSARDV